MQYYFETIFPRIPKPVQDAMVAQLAQYELPTKAVGNAGQGGPDRRGVEEPNRRPASVKASLSVAFGQRAPNRAAAREEGRGLGAGMKNTYGSALEDRARAR
jgi:pre-mRNA-splicing factor 38B